MERRFKDFDISFVYSGALCISSYFTSLALIILYNIFVEWVIIGIFYFILIFYQFPEWWGALLYFLIFATVTFIISSISVPALLRTFTYIRYLFSLERKPWKEVNGEARAAFLQLYFKIQQNRQAIFDKIEEEEEENEKKTEGGVYYLFLKIIHRTKDRIWEVRKQRASTLFNKVESRLQEASSELAEEREEYNKSIAAMHPKEIVKIVSALVITFVISIVLVTRESMEREFLVLYCFHSCSNKML